MSTNSSPIRVLRIDEVLPGDVLLCRSAASAKHLEQVAPSKYTHAAICVTPRSAAEASGHVVKEVMIQRLVNDYDHIAVLRQPDCWSPERIEKLQSFVGAAIAKRAKFNCDGIRNFEERRRVHQENLDDRLRDFFEGRGEGPNAERDLYFCSELVAAAHVAVGIVSPSAAIVYDPAVIAPRQLLEDFTYGIFLGYLVPYPEYVIPADDELLTAPRIDQILKGKSGG